MIKNALLKKSWKSFNANIFVHIHFKNKTKKWNSIFTFLFILCKFEQNLSKEVVKDVNGLNKLLFAFFEQRLAMSSKQKN